MSEPSVKTIPQPQKPDVSAEERARLLERLAKRIMDPDGFDREVLAALEADER